MTVGELKKALEAFPDNIPVEMACEGCQIVVRGIEMGRALPQRLGENYNQMPKCALLTE